MDSEARLLRALAALAAPAKDPAFTLAVMRAAERERFQAEAIRSVLRGTALAAAAAALAPPLMNWAAAHSEALSNGLLAAATLAATVVLSWSLARRITAM